MTLTRRQVLGTLGVLGVGAGAGALSWSRRGAPSRPASGACAVLVGSRIRWIVPHSAGGGYDAESRLIEPFLEARLQAEIVIENMPGAGGVLGARTIGSARPDGRTLGIIGAPGLLAATLIRDLGGPSADDPLDAAAFTTLGRVSRSWHVWATGRDSAFRKLDDALAAARVRPLVFGLSDVGGVNFISAGVAASLLRVPVKMVPGFQGSQAAALAAIRGDVDLVSFDFEAIRDLIATGELRPLLQVSDRSIDPHPSLMNVPMIGGPQGWMETHARGDGEAASRDTAMTTALVEVISAGRIIVAPQGLDQALAACLGGALHDTLSSPALRAAANRPLDIGTGTEARADVVAAARDLSALRQPLQDALAAIRG